MAAGGVEPADLDIEKLGGGGGTGEPKGKRGGGELSKGLRATVL